MDATIDFFRNGPRQGDLRSEPSQVSRRDKKIHPFKGEVTEERADGCVIDGCIEVKSVPRSLFTEKVAFWQELKNQTLKVFSSSLVIGVGGISYGTMAGPLTPIALAIYAVSVPVLGFAAFALFRHLEASRALENWRRAYFEPVGIRKRVPREGFSLFAKYPESIKCVTDEELISEWKREYRNRYQEMLRLESESEEKKRAFVKRFFQSRLFSSSFLEMTDRAGKTYKSLVTKHGKISPSESAQTFAAIVALAKANTSKFRAE